MKDKANNDKKKQPTARTFFKTSKKSVGANTENTVRFEPELDFGLSQSQVNERIAQRLINVSGKKYSKTYKSIFVSNIFTFFNFLCIFAMFALIFSGAPITQYLFVLIFVSNITIGIFQEIRAKIQIDKLSILAAAHIKTLRDGEIKELPTGELVLDDIIMLETGNQIPADCIIKSGSVEVNEALLTGESVPIKKDVDDIIYAGSFISSGSCKAKTEKVGSNTYVGSLTSQAKKYKKPNSEIMRSITMFIKVIGIMIIPIAIGMFIINWNRLSGDYKFFSPTVWADAHSPERVILNEAIQKTCAIIVGMIPSGMMLLTSMALAVGVIRLARKNTLVQDLYSLEMLARVDVLCLDKTGTITDGRMKVNDYKILAEKEIYDFPDIMSSMLSALPDNNQTSIALFNEFGHSAKFNEKKIIPFSSKRKYSAVTFDKIGTFALGAPEFIFKKLPSHLEKIINEYAVEGMRVLALAHSSRPIEEDELPSDMSPYAIISIKDNIRADAIASIKWFKENGVNVKIISGDNPTTVAEVARRAGVENAEKYISLEGLTNIEVETVANEYTVFGRVTPEQKAILVRAIKARGSTVAMTGDGVNDILALKEADCAISVASGAAAARNVSHIVLMDNNFNSMPEVVYEGRRVINNIENSSSLYLMKTFLVMFIAIFCLLTRKPYFFTTDNMIFFEMFISGLPSFFLSLQPNTKKVEGNFLSYVLSHSIPNSITMFLCVMTVYITHAIPSLCAEIYNPQTHEIEYSAMMVIAMTLSGVVMLYRICKPFNILRASLFVSVLVICILFLTVKKGDFAIGDIMFENYHSINFNASELLLLSTIISLAFPVSRYMVIFCEKLGKSFESHKL